MSNFSVYILVLVLNINNCFFQQLFKLPVLFQHYSEHQQGSPLSFAEYLDMHYWGQDIEDDDDDRDMQLPFKQVDCGAIHTVFIPTNLFAMNCFVPDVCFEHSDFRTVLYSNPNQGELFRPPMV